jgi:hypothetical protein
MGLRDDLITLVDEIREDIIDDLAELRLHTVRTVLRTWTGAQPGLGTATDTKVDLAPKPRVRAPSPRLVTAAPGKFEEGDRVVDRVSATYTEAQLTGGTLTAKQEWWWEVDGDAYRVVAQPEKRYLDWRVHLRRMRTR